MPLLFMALLACVPAVAAVETYAPPSTSRMSALDRENDVVTPAPPPAPSPGAVAMPIAFVGYGIAATAAVSVATITLLSTWRFEALFVGSTIGAVLLALGPAVALGAFGEDLPLLVMPAAAVGTAIGIVALGTAGVVAGTYLSQALIPRGTDCIGCTDAEVIGFIAPPAVGALLGGAAGLFTTMTIVSVVVLPKTATAIE